ncbi:carbohydrate binding domain-containing protein [Paenibacillus sp. JDR-2]|uniref:carbohydrate binding domain-containing protein n=1 Tax=Paenibacillus sp. (strain JDR-2) TaxID=324057 RepID=UPI0001666CC9|nr:carbohydrate binding domain-containing protein [Paenibacillus sp. JDR-2]ACT01197.1 Carbohydrate-binding CenC domain protein [Paenibacillus sp. JDR-2]
MERRKKRKLFIMLIVTAALFVQCLGSVSNKAMAQGNGEIVHNGDFSQGLSDWWLDTGKTSFETADGWATFTPLINDDMWEQSLGQTTGALSKDVEYTFSFDAKAQVERGIEVWLRAAGSDGNTVVLSQQTLTLGQEKHYSVTFTPAEDLESATLQIPFGGDMTAFSLKQISIRSTTVGGEDPGEGEGGATPLPPVNTMLLNPGLEDGINNWQAWGEGFTAASDMSHTGSASLKVLLNNGGRQVVALQPGKSYKLGVWGKTAGTGTGTQTATVMINYKKPEDDSSHTYGSFQFGPDNSEFTYKEITFETPDDMAQEWGTQFVSIWSEGADQVYLDDFTLSEVSDGDSGEQPQTPGGPQSLTGLKVDDTAIPDFDPAAHTYYYDLAVGTTAVPAVTATAQESNQVTIEQAQGLPGQAVITVSDSEGTNRYIVHFRLVQPAAINENFETTEIGGLPAGWTKNGSNPDEGTYEVVSQDGGKQLKVKHDLQNSPNGLTKSFDPQTGNFTFEYRMKNTDQGAVSIVRLWDSASGQDALSLVEAWGLRFNMVGENFDSTEAPGHRIVDGDFNTSEWRNYKLIVHVPTHTYDIYLNGELKQQNIPFLGDVDKIDRMSIGHIFWSTATTTSIDDVRLQPLPFVNNHVRNGDFKSGLEHWSVSGSGAELSNDHGRGRIDIEAGKGPAVVKLDGADAAPGQSYTLRFSMRGSKPADVNVKISGNEGEDLIKSAAIETTEAPGQYEVTFTPGADAAAPQMTSITWTINGDSSANWTGYLDHVQLLTSDAVVPLPEPSESVAVDWIKVTDGETELPYSGVSFKDVSVQFVNESFTSIETTYVIELREASGGVVDRSTVQSEASVSESSVIHAGFIVPGNAVGYRIYAYAINPKQSSAYSPVIAADVS